MAEQIVYEGLREVLQSLAVVNTQLYDHLVKGLVETGEVVEHDARRRFTAYKPDRLSWKESADTFETRVRAGGTAMALVVVGQRRRSTRDQARRRPNYGGLQMKRGLLPARAANMGVAADILEHEVISLMKANGF